MGEIERKWRENEEMERGYLLAMAVKYSVESSVKSLIWGMDREGGNKERMRKCIE